MEQMEWFLLITQLPSNPSSLRVNVWRRLKNAGATSYQNSAWMLPKNTGNETFLKRLQIYIKENKATAQLFILQSVDESSNDDIKKRFISDRDEEYEEVLEQCIEFQDEMKDEIDNKVLKFIELEDNEQKFRRLEKWISKIHKRDFLESAKYQDVLIAAQQCLELLQKYARLVYEKEGMMIDQDYENIPDDGLLSDFEESTE